MANRSVVAALVDQVAAFFASEGIDTIVALGFQEAPRQNNQGADGANRIVFDLRKAKDKWLPTRGGSGHRDMNDGNRARVLGTLQWSIPVQFWAADRSTNGDPENERAQLEAYVTMFERATQAIHSYAHGSWSWAEGAAADQPVERAFGRAWNKVLVLDEQIFDVEYGVARPTATFTKEMSP